MIYTYKIESINEDLNIMEVVYTHDIHGETTVSMEIPYTDYDLDLYIQMHAPKKVWDRNEKTRMLVAPGTVGEIQEEQDPGIDYQQIALEIYKDAPPALLNSVQKIKEVERKNLLIEELHRDAHPIALHLIGPTEQTSSQTFSSSIFALGKVVNLAKKLGVPCYGVASSDSYKEYAVNHLNAKVHEVESGYPIVYIEWNTDMQTAVYNTRKEIVREKRNKLLLECDWIHLPDSPDISNINDWETYRQSLRDITDQSGFPETVVWPQKPAEI